MKKLNRFTTIPFLMDMLIRKQLTLLNPSHWEDKNDTIAIESYRQKKNKKSIYALCMMDSVETIHHWKAFASGDSGCCIEFNYDKLIKEINEFKEKNSYDIRCDSVDYKTSEGLNPKEKNIEHLPFLKRKPFEPENEFRIVMLSDEEQKKTFDISIPLDVIQKITIAYKMPEPVFESVKKCIEKIVPEFKGKINHSTLLENDKWIEKIKQIQ